VDVQSFEEKKRLLDKIDKLAIKKTWSRFDECRRACYECRERNLAMKVRFERISGEKYVQAMQVLLTNFH